jgi:hypothetical protein
MRFYAESDGDPNRMFYYVCDKCADPLSETRRTDCKTMAKARKLAKKWNAAPPWPAWDTIQAKRDLLQGVDMFNYARITAYKKQ